MLLQTKQQKETPFSIILQILTPNSILISLIEIQITAIKNRSPQLHFLWILLSKHFILSLLICTFSATTNPVITRYKQNQDENPDPSHPNPNFTAMKTLSLNIINFLETII